MAKPNVSLFSKVPFPFRVIGFLFLGFGVGMAFPKSAIVHSMYVTGSYFPHAVVTFAGFLIFNLLGGASSGYNVSEIKAIKPTALKVLYGVNRCVSGPEPRILEAISRQHSFSASRLAGNCLLGPRQYVSGRARTDQELSLVSSDCGYSAVHGK